jgi:glycosyltransferase involved in cell wall biosynthesis
MKVLYDISVLGYAHTNSCARTGIFRVVENLADGLSEIENIEMNFCATSSLDIANAALDYLQIHPKFSVIPFSTLGWQREVVRKTSDAMSNINKSKNISFNHKIIRRVLFAIHNVVQRQVRVPLNLNEVKRSDIFHSPYHQIPSYIQSISKIKKILTVYDLIPLLHPQFFEFEEEHLVKTALDKLQPDNWVTCISHSTKSDLCNYLVDLDPERVVVTHLAASDLFYPCADASLIELTRQKYCIPDAPYILSVSTLEPRKNIDRTIRCFAKLLEQENIDDLHLVLVGSKGWNFEKIFQELDNLKHLRNRIVITGYVADEDLAPLYSNAIAFVYPSFYEGFGLPPLEAMQCGIPVITSNTSSLPEVVGDAGIMVAPLDDDAICQGMLDVYNCEELRSQMSLKSILQSKKFSWDNCTQQTLHAYNLAIDAV